MDDFPTRLARIHDAISSAAKKAGRDPSTIELLAVSKTQPAEAIHEALRAGVTQFGENKVQEARAKIEEVGRGSWHLIGHLQSNKAKEAVRLRGRIPAGVAVVAESGIGRRGGVAELEEAGVDAILVGETLMRADDPAAAAAMLLGREAVPEPEVGADQ